jgi:hypothetical protein
MVTDPCTMLQKAVFLELVQTELLKDNELTQKETHIQLNNNDIMTANNNLQSVAITPKTLKVTSDSHTKEQIQLRSSTPQNAKICR